jgi:hypothetical protein
MNEDLTPTGAEDSKVVRKPVDPTTAGKTNDDDGSRSVTKDREPGDDAMAEPEAADSKVIRKPVDPATADGSEDNCRSYAHFWCMERN